MDVIKTYRNAKKESLIWIQYRYDFKSLLQSIRLIRERILIGLIPSLIVGLILALVFAQLLIRPIRGLMAALKRVSEGNYDVSVSSRRRDEIGELEAAFNSMTNELRKKKELQKYLSDSTYRQIMETAGNPLNTERKGSRVMATVLFCDIRNFVGHCENLDAEEITRMLNEYFTEMVEVVHRNGGEVDKFIGDAFLSVFYEDPEGKKSNSLQSIYCALQMRDRLTEYNLRRTGQGKEPIEIGVGITYGEVISGPIGSKDRMDFTVIGDAVNLASRIEKLSKKGHYTKIVFSGDVELQVRDLLNYQQLGFQTIQGMDKEIQVFELVGIKDLHELLKNLTSADLPLKRKSLEILGHSRNPDALESLYQAFQDQDEACRVQAILAVGRIASKDVPDILDRLIKVVQNTDQERIITAGISVFGRLCTSDRLFELVPYLNHSNERIVANAIEALGQVQNPKLLDLILPIGHSIHHYRRGARPMHPIGPELP